MHPSFLTIHYTLRIGSKEVIEQLADAMVIHGILQYIRSDNGPEFVAQLLRDWLKENCDSDCLH